MRLGCALYCFSFSLLLYLPPHPPPPPRPPPLPPFSSSSSTYSFSILIILPPLPPLLPLPPLPPPLLLGSSPAHTHSFLADDLGAEDGGNCDAEQVCGEGNGEGVCVRVCVCEGVMVCNVWGGVVCTNSRQALTGKNSHPTLITSARREHTRMYFL